MISSRKNVFLLNKLHDLRLRNLSCFKIRSIMIIIKRSFFARSNWQFRPNNTTSMSALSASLLCRRILHESQNYKKTFLRKNIWEDDWCKTRKCIKNFLLRNIGDMKNPTFNELCQCWTISLDMFYVCLVVMPHYFPYMILDK